MSHSKYIKRYLPVTLAILCAGVFTQRVGDTQVWNASAYAALENRVSYEAPPEPAPVKHAELIQEKAHYQKLLKEKIAQVISNYNTGLNSAGEKRLPDIIIEQSHKNGYDPFILTGVIITESTFFNWAKSHRGALGLMQILPSTGRELAGELNIPWKGKETLFDPEINITLGAHYLKKLVNRFGSFSLALEAYNHGPARLSRYLKRGRLPKIYSQKVFNSYEEVRIPSLGPRVIHASFPADGTGKEYWAADMNVTEQPDPIQETDVSDAGAKAKSQTETSPNANLSSGKVEGVEQTPDEPGPVQNRGIYGPIAPGESVIKVVKKLGFANGDVARVSVALWMDNKNQFINENIHGLKQGATLNLSGIAVLKDHLTAHTAGRMIDDQWQRWVQGQKGADTVANDQLAVIDKTEPLEKIDAPATRPTLAAVEEKSRQKIKQGDTLLVIAARLGFDSKEAQSAVVAIWMENKDKFIRGNLNGLKVGQTLDLAHVDSRRKDLDPSTVNQIIESQWQEWIS